jgi:outer membrane protein OmpA-like peptidoglycan-associated protein
MKKILLISWLIAATSWGQTQPLTSATPDQLEQQLAPFATVHTRSLRNLAPQQQSVDLVIQFDFDSAQLLPASKPLLNNLALAMKRERLQALQFRVEGHTDAKGSANYNQQLSERRAAAVVAYLQTQGIEVQRLSLEGKGSSELLLPDQPFAMENRRVRVVALP